MTQTHHTSVSNQPPTESALVQATVFRPPNRPVPPPESALRPGSAPQQQKELSGIPVQEIHGETEDIEGYDQPGPESLLSGEWTAPSAVLPDIGQASFGPPPSAAETVHGPDDRVQILNTAMYPWSAHASLLITANDYSSWIGTGWFIGPHTLATAGHCVYIKNSGVAGRDGWVRSIQVMPGRNGALLPFGFVTSSIYYSVTGWTVSGDENYDYAAINTPTNLGNITGWLGIGSWPDAELLATAGNIAGYPGDKPAGTQWYASRQISSVTPLKVYYDIDTAGGQSGTAVYRAIGGDRYGFAIHAYGGTTVNSGTRINRAVYDNLVAWSA
ncbi:trypsin-like serine peptidase [Streptomyces sp. NPDC085466]|uniref:trypsin-like serine peptidase n=1 Tax=Streptomyces sp. NPDC085466 TaxID=3365725 RepID=UPI0037D7EFD5